MDRSSATMAQSSTGRKSHSARFETQHTERGGCMAVAAEKAIRLGHPSYIWRRGQDRRLNLIRQYVALEGRRILDVGCGIGMYVEKFRRFSTDVYGVDVDA